MMIATLVGESRAEGRIRGVPGWSMAARLSVEVIIVAYQPMTLVQLAEYHRGEDDALRWRLVAEFLEEFRQEPTQTRFALLVDEPGPTGDERWDVFLAALAEHLAFYDERGGPMWVHSRRLDQFWFPFNTRAARADAMVHSPASFRCRGIFVSPHELKVV
ncbi:MAG: hypothetical protein ACRC0L_06265 [Angustibacter sp.]